MWKSFNFEELFDIRSGVYGVTPEHITCEDSTGKKIPYVSATSLDNGVSEWFTIDELDASPKSGEVDTKKGRNQPLDVKLCEGNCITVSNNGSVGEAFYQERQFTCSQDVTRLYPKNWTLNRAIALYICTVIKNERYRFSYGRKWKQARMKKSSIWLPVTEDGTPDWKKMEDMYNKIYNNITINGIALSVLEEVCA